MLRSAPDTMSEEERNPGRTCQNQEGKEVAQPKFLETTAVTEDGGRDSWSEPFSPLPSPEALFILTLCHCSHK